MGLLLVKIVLVTVIRAGKTDHQQAKVFSLLSICSESSLEDTAMSELSFTIDHGISSYSNIAFSQVGIYFRRIR